MKLALIVICGIAAIAFGIYVVGALLPKSHRVSRSAIFHAPPERLFALIDGAQDWRPDIVRAEIVSDGANRRRIRETGSDGSVVTYELLDATPPTSLTRRIATENLPYSGTWTFALHREAETTLVQITEDGEVYSPIFRFVSRFIMGQQRSIDNYLRALGRATGEEAHLQN
jgi:hypothetical protein